MTAPAVSPPEPGTTPPPAGVPRTRLRRVLVLAGLLPTLLVLAFVLKVVLMLAHDGAGRDQFADGDYAAAAGEFAANDRLNLFEPWIAAFDEGAARHADGDLEAAIGLYDVALEDVPAAEECTVRINQALAHETLGDTTVEAGGDPVTAIEHWQAGIDTLAAGDCPLDAGRGEQQTSAAAAVDQRLRDKIEQQQQQSQQQQNQQQQQPDKKQQPDPKEERLERRNGEAIEEKKDYEDTYRDRDYSEYEW